MARSPKPKFRSVRTVGLLGSIPLLLAVAPLMGYAIGYYLDRWLHTGWVLRLVFLGLGFVAGVREMLRLLRRARQESDER